MRVVSNSDLKERKPFEYYEYKYLVEDKDLQSVLAYLSTSMSNIDPYPEGWVSSLYYDSLDQRAYHECNDGASLKRKFRLRFYSDSDFSNAGQVQVKEKQMSAIFKYKAPLKKQAISDITDFAWPEEVDSLAIRSLASSYGPLKPLILVKYFRYRFRMQDLRITLDTKINFEAGTALYDAKKSFGSLPFSILELKTLSERPQLPTNKLLELPQLSFSKFYSGVQYLKGEESFFNKYLQEI